MPSPGLFVEAPSPAALMPSMVCLQAADEAILVLAPMLLLMNQDPLVFRSLSERRRYAPLVLALTAYLTFSAVTGAFQAAGAASERSPFVMEQKQPSGAWLLVKNLVLLALAFPNHALFLRVRPMPAIHPLHACKYLLRQPFSWITSSRLALGCS